MTKVVPAAFSLPPELVEDLKLLAEAKDQSTSKYVKQVLQRHVDQVRRQQRKDSQRESKNG